MATPTNPLEVGFDKRDVQIVEKDIPEAQLKSTFSKITTGSDGLLTVILFSMLVITFALTKLLPSVDQYLSILQNALTFGK
jgi:hypothetical protein